MTAAAIDLRRVLGEIAKRKIEALRLYRPMPFQQAFHASMAPERIIRGGNRSGKTTGAAIEVARAVTGQDPFNKYPKENGICYIIAKQGKELAQVSYQLLFRAGAFRMIRDEYTKEWRAYDPQNPFDLARKNETRPAPPLIPHRFVKSIAWEDKKRHLPATIYLANGWALYFYSSEAEPTQGTAIDLAWMDEEIIKEEWYVEVSARLIDKSGRFIWSATPQAGTERLFLLHERAEQEVIDNVQPRSVDEFFCDLEGNKYMSDVDKKIFADKHKDDDFTYRIRVKGEFAILSGLVFPEYSPTKEGQGWHEIDPFKIPEDWTRYAAIDPGYQVCGVLFGAVPPPDKGDFFYIYDELYIRQCSAELFGTEMGKKQVGQRFYAFYIDMREARKHYAGGGKMLLDLYIDALKANNVKSQVTGHEFLTGNDNVRAGVEAVRFWLRARVHTNRPKLQVFKTCKNFCDEIRKYRNKRAKDPDGVMRFMDEPIKKRDHLMDGLRYLVQADPTWHPLPAPVDRPSGAYAWWLKQKEKKGPAQLMLGPGDGHARTDASW